jgi:glycosyltransferase involved in cell wall biosynthesis
MVMNPPSVYHVLYGDTDVLLLGQAKRLRKHRLVATFHEPPDKLEWLKINEIVPCLDAVILVSESQRPYFDGLIPPERIFVVPHGVNPDFFRPAVEIADDSICITVGAHLRDFQTLKSAMDVILTDAPRTRFIAVGARREEPGNQQLNDERVEFHDGVSDEELRSLYQSARLAIFPLRYATANNSVLEAMACGLPVVATDVGGVREYMGEQAGFLVPPSDHEAMASVVLRLLRDRPLARTMGAAARARALGFDYRIVAERMKAVYEAVYALQCL